MPCDRRADGRLRVGFVLRGAQDGDQLDGRIVRVHQRAADEFEIPARFAFDIQDAHVLLRHINQPHYRIVLDIFFACLRLDADLKTVRAGRAGIEHDGFALLHVRLQRDLLLAIAWPFSRTTSFTFAPAYPCCRKATRALTREFAKRSRGYRTSSTSMSFAK